jgi:hypothetical protein
MNASARRAAGVAAAFAMATGLAACLHPSPPAEDPLETPATAAPGEEGGDAARVPALMRQTEEEAGAKSRGCLVCHEGVEKEHASRTVHIGCTDCHGGDADAAEKDRAHVLSGDRARDARSAVLPDEITGWHREPADYVRFVNPGDLRVAAESCGVCHPVHSRNTAHSMMAHGAFLWGAALYNNGSYPLKRPHFGEAYDRDGNPARLQTVPAPTGEEIARKGVLAWLDPLPRWEVTQMGNILRTFERGGRRPLELGNPDPEEEAGLPARRLSDRGLGTKLRTDPVFLGLQKTRLLDPLLWEPGTNDHPGDYRQSGCTACHMVYANDRDASHSGHYAEAGNRGTYGGGDPTIPKGESGHPIRHVLTRSIPSSQCMVCHMHPGTSMVASYFGDLWWDNESDGQVLYYGHRQERDAEKGYIGPSYRERANEPTPQEIAEVRAHNPEGAAVRGRWSNPGFLASASERNNELSSVQLEDYHGHGWLFRKVFKKDRKGNMLDAEGAPIPFDDPKKWEKAVHLKDIHLERGMHCVDCHFTQDVHGDGKLYGEPRNAVEIGCEDCHGSVSAPTKLVSSGPPGGRDLSSSQTPFGKRFFKRGGVLYQRSQVEKDVVWAVPQVADSIDPSKAGQSYEIPGRAPRPVYNERARWAKTVQRDGATWGEVPADGALLAHRSEKMSCVACHTSWTTSCFGCHLSMEANEKAVNRHYEGGASRNWTSYNFQVLRDDAYMLGVDGDVTGNRISPVRSACAIVVGSENQNREHLYSQQQTVSAEGFSGHAFSTYVPHTVRGRETKGCADCHLTDRNDNNAVLAQLFLQGTNFVSFEGRWCWVACGEGGFYGVAVTERDEPQAVLGSTLHRDAFPDRYRSFVEKDGRVLKDSHHHDGEGTASLQVRGEYLYAAEEHGGLRVYDVSAIDNKGFSERITTAPVSPLGQGFLVPTRAARAVASPTTLGVDPTRPHRPENREQSVHPLYAFLYVADEKEGLVMVCAATLLDGDPSNNFLKRDLVFNPDGILDGARTVAVAGDWAYVGCDAGLVVLDLGGITLEDPTPKVARVIGPEKLKGVTSVQVQFRYAFVTDSEGLKVLDVTLPAQADLIPGASVGIGPCSDVCVARTYAYVSAGEKGLVVVDVENPEKPVLDRTFDAGGAMNDVRMARVAMTNASLFAYVADGRNGLRVLQLTSPEAVPGYGGFSPRPDPVLIATFPTPKPALALGRPLDRDRAVDESGNQLSVFGRLGARPLNLAEQQAFYLRDGKVFRVPERPRTKPIGK